MKNIYIFTQGCSHNRSDSECMAGLLEQAGYRLIDSPQNADLVIINTCTVKTPTENAFLRKLNKLRNKRMIIAGCIPQSEPSRFKEVSTVGTKQVHNIVQAVEQTLEGNIVHLTDNDEVLQLSTPKIRLNPFVEIIPISSGCIGYCSFCKTKFARGNLVSFPAKDIVNHIRQATSEGVKEIWLTSEDTGCYGFDIKTNLANLLKEICNIGKDFMVRVGMANPDNILKIKDNLIEAYKDKKIYKFLHIPVQSGNDEVLKLMKRNYTVDDFKNTVNSFRKQIQDITISTDIICGFPTETDRQFADTILLMKQIKPDVINISRFWPRPGTVAAKLPQIVNREVTKRSHIMTDLSEQLFAENNKKWLGWKGRVLVTEKGKNNSLVGRNYVYKPVVIDSKQASKKFKLGQFLDVEVIDANIYYLKGLVVNNLA